MTFSELLQQKGIRLSDEQMAAVRAERAAVVSAGAGSGKTTVLSLRFVRLVLERKAHADEILTLTFTRKAAAEMYERIYGLLSYAAEHDEYAAEELSSRFPKARISTLDSFWGEIARTDSLRYGIMRDFSLMEADDLQDIVRMVFDELSEDQSLDDAFVLLSSSYSEDEILGFLMRVASDFADVITGFSSEGNMESYELYRKLVTQRYLPAFDSVLDELERLNESDPDSKLYESIKSFLYRYRNNEIYIPDFSLNLLRRKCDKELASLIKNVYRPIREKVLGAFAIERSRDYADAVSRLLERFIRRVQTIKRTRSSITFHDAARMAKAILLSDRSVRDYYSSLFRYIMVDEFQDNNGEQRDLLYLLASGREAPMGRIPLPSEIDPQKLFFVGDDKQSIYYFRGADVSVFRSLRDDIKAMGGKYLTLSTNYRSEPGLIDHFSSVFSQVFAQSRTDLEGEDILEEMTGVPYAPFEADYAPIGSRDASLGIVSRIRMALVPRKDDLPEDTASAEDSEAYWVAGEIRKMTEGDDYLIPDGKGGVRKPRFSDIALLLQTTKSQLAFERVFRLSGIPYTVAESASVAIEGLAYDLYAFLTLVIYPDDKAMYLALLRSPFARISDDGLMFLTDWSDDENDDFTAFSDTPCFTNEEDEAAFRNLRKLYEDTRKMAGRKHITELLDTIYYRSGYHSYLVSDPSLAVYEEHFSYLWAAAARADARGKSLQFFLDSIRPLIGSPEKLPDATVQHFESDAVEIMSIHRSKGLQFPIVIVADATRGSGGQTERNNLASIQGDHPFIMIDPKSGDMANHPYTSFQNMAALRREKAEKKRVLYVALTRAACHLIVTGCERRTMASSLYGLYAPCSGLREEEIPYISSSLLFASIKEQDSSSWYEGRSVYAHGKEGSVRTGVTVSLDIPDETGEGTPLPSLSSDEIVRAHGIHTEFGSMVHEALEAAVLVRSPVFSKIPGLDEDGRRVLEEEASSLARLFLSSSFFSSFIKGHECGTEVRFYYPDDGMVIEGSADLVVHLPSSVLIVDFKTDRMMRPEVHKAQVMKYIEALGGLYGKECYGVLLYVRSMTPGPLWNREGEVRELSELLSSV